MYLKLIWGSTFWPTRNIIIFICSNLFLLFSFRFFIVCVKNRWYNNPRVFILKNMLSFAILIFFHKHKHAHTQADTSVHAHFSSYFLFSLVCSLFPPATHPVSLLYKHIPAFCVTSNKISNFEQMALYGFASFLLYVCPSVPLSPPLSVFVF